MSSLLASEWIPLNTIFLILPFRGSMTSEEHETPILWAGVPDQSFKNENLSLVQHPFRKGRLWERAWKERKKERSAFPIPFGSFVQWTHGRQDGCFRTNATIRSRESGPPRNAWNRSTARLSFRNVRGVKFESIDPWIEQEGSSLVLPLPVWEENHREERTRRSKWSRS